MILTRVIASGAVFLAVATLSGCASKADSMLVRESFDSDNTYSRSFDVEPAQACEAARRTLLSQGYAVKRSDNGTVEGSKNFQPKDDLHEQLDIRVSCVTKGDGKSWVFVSALQDKYGLKKSATSASVGVGALGSVSLPFGSSDDSMVLVASSTIQEAAFYNRFFERLDAYLPRVSAGPAQPSAAVKPAAVGSNASVSAAPRVVEASASVQPVVTSSAPVVETAASVAAEASQSTEAAQERAATTNSAAAPTSDNDVDAGISAASSDGSANETQDPVDVSTP